MHKLLVCLALLALPPAATHAFAALPDNPIAIGNCTATVKVDAARLRSGPSLFSKVLGVRIHDDSLFVAKVQGKWVQVVLAEGDTAYMAAYLLAFPANQVLEQWKRDSPSPSVGKKAKVKWAQVEFRKYPSAHAPSLGRLDRGDEVAVLTDLGNGWSLAESRKAEGDGACYGFIEKASLAAVESGDMRAWGAPLSRVRLNPGETVEAEPIVETPAQYCQRTAWTPELFELRLQAEAQRSLADPAGEPVTRPQPEPLRAPGPETVSAIRLQPLLAFR